MACSKVTFTFYLYRFDVQQGYCVSEEDEKCNSGTLASSSGTDEGDKLDAVCVCQVANQLLLLEVANFPT